MMDANRMKEQSLNQNQIQLNSGNWIAAHNKMIDKNHWIWDKLEVKMATWHWRWMFIMKKTRAQVTRKQPDNQKLLSSNEKNRGFVTSFTVALYSLFKDFQNRFTFSMDNWSERGHEDFVNRLHSSIIILKGAIAHLE